VIVDDLSNSKIEKLNAIRSITTKNPIFYPIDVTNKEELESVFKRHKLDGVIHFAGMKSVAESVKYPLNYYYNNLVGTIVVANLCEKYNIKRFVFSSSATVYGNNKSPLIETMEMKKTTNPYGETKAMCERILTDFSYTMKDSTISL